MKILPSVFATLDNFNSKIIGKLFKTNLEDYCFLNSIIGDNLITDEGDLITIFKIGGIKNKRDEPSNIKDYDELEEYADNMVIATKNFFERNEHQMQFVYIRDKYKTKKLLEDLQHRQEVVANEMGSSIKTIINDRNNKLFNFVISEESYIVLQTNLKTAIKINDDDRYEVIDLYNKLPPISNTQDLIGVYKKITQKHNSFINIMENILSGELDLLTYKLTGEEAVRVIRSQIASSLSSDNFKVKSSNSKKPQMREPRISSNENDISDYLFTDLKSQLIPYQQFILEDESTLKIYDKYYRTLNLSTTQETKKSFNKLLATIGKDISFIMSIKINGRAISSFALKKLLATLFAWSPVLSENKEIKSALDYYKVSAIDGFCPIKFNIGFTVFDDQKDKLNKNFSNLESAISSWGAAGVTTATDSPYSAFFSNITAFSKSTYGESFIENFHEITYIMPINLTSSPYQNDLYTDVIVRDDLGKVVPIQLMSDENESKGEAIIALSGKGKSVWANNLNFNFLLKTKPNEKVKSELPLLSMLDIGFSSKGFFQLAKRIFKNKQDQFFHLALENSKEYAINHFDTFLGCRFPTIKERTNLASFLATLFSDGTDEIVELTGLINEIIKRIYIYYSDNMNPKKYYKDELILIDKKLERLGFNNPSPCWWDVVDFLFKNNEIELASKAQTRAMPLLEDISSILANDQSLSSKYSKVKIKSETAVEFINRKITESINDYPLLNYPSVIDTNNKRVCIIDLQSVTLTATKPSEIRTNAVFYMLGRFAVTKNFFISDQIFRDEYVKFARNNIYTNYWKEQYIIYKNLPKRLVYDEMHRTKGVNTIRNQLVQDLRESRKWGLGVSLISQHIDDYLITTGEKSSPILLEMCATKYFFSLTNIEKIVDLLGLPNNFEKLYKDKLFTETEGKCFVGIFDIAKRGKIHMKLISTMSSIELWALNSTPSDYMLRDELFDIYGEEKTFKILRDYAPEGTFFEITKKILKDDPRASPNDVIKKEIKQKYASY